MENLNDKISELLNKSKWTDKEKQWLLSYLESGDGEELRELMEESFNERNAIEQQLDQETSKEILQNIYKKLRIVKPVKRGSIIKMWIIKVAVASVIVFLVLGVYTKLITNTEFKLAPTKQSYQSVKKDSLSSDNKAVLILADGSKIVLDNSQDGALVHQGNTTVIKVGGKLAYDLKKKGNNGIIYQESGQTVFNTIATARGGQYQIELPDGSQVWLNAMSSLHFPTSFDGNERRVKVTGEAYFEVTKNASMPFIVEVDQAEVQVMGTHFNIMAYNEEGTIKTTLLEGEVKFVGGHSRSILKPGQQSQLRKNGDVKVFSDVNVAEAVAWKNGFFDFNGLDIETISRQLSRWYKIEILQDKKINDLFYAKIPRNTKLSDVLKALELTGKVRFKTEGEKITVMP